MSTVTTEQGTELKLTNLKGKAYLDVPKRVIWFREECHGYGIETEFLTASKEEAVARATVRDAAGKIVAQGTKRCTAQEFRLGHIEKAETGAIGRALGFLGYGTEAALDLDEREDKNTPNPVIADAPIAPRPRLPAVSGGDPGDFVITSIKELKGMKLSEVDDEKLDGLLRWANGLEAPKPHIVEMRNAIDAYLDQKHRPMGVSK